MEFQFAKRMESLPPYLFAELGRMKSEMTAKGVDVIDLGIGDPDLPTPSVIVKQMKKEVSRRDNHNYPPYYGLDELRIEIANFFKERFSVSLDFSKEVLPLIGSKEGIFHLPFVLLNEGDFALIPDPGYPVYSISSRLAGGSIYYMPLLKQNDFLPDLKNIPDDIAGRAKIIYINYPNNPTSAGASRKFFEELYEFSEKYNLVVCHDAAYSEIYYGKEKPSSFLSVDRGKRHSLEFHSLSKTFNMTGWRIGFVAGNEKLIGALGKLKTNIDSGVFKAIQRASIAGLKRWKELTNKNRKVFSKRIKLFGRALRKLGYNFKDPSGTFYLWVEVPLGLRSKAFAERLLKEVGVVVAPGIGMGESGDNYFRISVTVPDKRLIQALQRFKKFRV